VGSKNIARKRGVSIFLSVDGRGKVSDLKVS